MPSMMSRVASAWRTLFRKSRLERELDDELRGAAGALEDRYVAQGMSRDDARRAARLALGGVESVKEAVRDVRVGAQIESFVMDARYGCALRQSPPSPRPFFRSLGISANTAIFTFINALLLRRLPVHDPSALVEVTAVRKNGYGLLSFRHRDITSRQRVLPASSRRRRDAISMTVPSGSERPPRSTTSACASCRQLFNASRLPPGGCSRRPTISSRRAAAKDPRGLATASGTVSSTRSVSVGRFSSAAPAGRDQRRAARSAR
jgi:hypothetical protein